MHTIGNCYSVTGYPNNSKILLERVIMALFIYHLCPFYLKTEPLLTVFQLGFERYGVQLADAEHFYT